MESASVSHARLSAEERRRLLAWLCQVPAVAEMLRTLPADQYRVVFPSGVRGALGASQAGGLTANLHDPVTGRIVGQARLENAGPEMSLALNQVAMQTALREIAHRLADMEAKLDAVLAGQQADRLGLVESGVHLFHMAAEATLIDNQRQMLTHALAQLSEGRGRLLAGLDTALQGVETLPRTKWSIIRASVLGRNPVAEAERTRESIERHLEPAARATCVMALACGHLGEPGMLRPVWEPVGAAVARLTRANENLRPWLPAARGALPDRLDTLIGTLAKIRDTGPQLEAAPDALVELLFSAADLGEVVNG
jgi:hypothetical protein